MSTTLIPSTELAKPHLAMPSLRRNVAWTMAGNAVYSACQWLMLVILARLGTTETVGLFALAIAVAGPIVMLANMQLRWVQATDHGGEFEFNDCLTLRVISSVLAILAILTISLMTGYERTTLWIIAAVAVAKAIESVSDVLYGWYQQHERMELISHSLMIRGPISVAAIGITFWWTDSLLLATWALAAAWLVTLCAYDIPSLLAFRRDIDGAHLQLRWNPQHLKRIFLKTLPVGLMSGVMALEANIPRYVVERELGASELGVFAAMAYIMMAAYMIIQAVNQSALPRLAKYREQQNTVGFRTVLWNLVGMGFGIGMILVLGTAIFGRPFLYHAYGPEYAHDPGLLIGIMVSCAILFAFRPAEVALLSMRRFWLLLVLHAGGLPVLIIATLLLVPHFGLWGAVYAMIAQATLHGVVTCFIYSRQSLQTTTP